MSLISEHDPLYKAVIDAGCQCDVMNGAMCGVHEALRRLMSEVDEQTAALQAFAKHSTGWEPFRDGYRWGRSAEGRTFLDGLTFRVVPPSDDLVTITETGRYTIRWNCPVMPHSDSYNCAAGDEIAPCTMHGGTTKAVVTKQP